MDIRFCVEQESRAIDSIRRQIEELVYAQPTNLLVVSGIPIGTPVTSTRPGVGCVLDLLERSTLPAGDSMFEWLGQVRKLGIRVRLGIAAVREARDER